MLTGGNCKFGNFYQRVVQELRPLVRDNYDVCVHMGEDPVLTTYHGGARALSDDQVPLNFVTKALYEENGSDAVLRQLYKDSDNDG